MSNDRGWVQRQRRGLWHLRTGGVKKYKDWKRREYDGADQNKMRAHRSSSYAENPIIPTTIDELDAPVIAGLATVPARLSSLRDAFNSILWQVDEVHVFLNNFDDVPKFLIRPNVTIYRSQDYDDFKDVGKFFALTQRQRGILFTVDDDILYPPDYVSRLLTYLASTEYKAVVGVHGFQLPEFPTSFFDRHTFHFPKKLDEPALASVVGTGTIAFDIETVGLEFEDFTSYGMADIHLALHLKKNRIPAIIVPRPAQWLVPVSLEEAGNQEPTLFDKTQSDHTLQSKLLRQAAPWGEIDTLARWNALLNKNLLSNTLNAALQIINDASKTPNRKADIAEQSKIPQIKSKLKTWIDIYGNRTTKERIYTSAFETQKEISAKLLAIDGIRAENISQAIHASRSLISEHPQDVQVVRKHAHLCEAFYLEDEAEEHYLRLIRLNGVISSEDTARYLFEYFRFLVRFGGYETAATLISTLESTHKKSPTYLALKINIALVQGDVVTAQSGLNLLSQFESRSRVSALNILVRSIVDLELPSIAEPLLTQDMNNTYSENGYELLALLKIATAVGDATSAKLTWDSLVKNFQPFLDSHREIALFYGSNWEEHSVLADTDGDPLIHRPLYQITEKADGTISAGNKNEPLVSVILTAFNSEKTLDSAVASILQQTYTNLELIVIDDKSTDSTPRIVEKWAQSDARVSLIQNDSNLGPYTSRNRAVGVARGSFIAIQDADDISALRRLDLQIEAFTPDIQAVLGRHVRVNSAGAVQLENDGSILGHGPVTLVVRSEALKHLGQFANVRTRGDKEFESRLENFFGTHAVLRLSDLVVYALDDKNSNSKKETDSLDKKRRLMLFKEEYGRKHSAHKW